MLVCKCLVLSVTLPAISTMQAMQVNAPPIHTSMAASNAAVLRKEGEQPAEQQQWRDTFHTIQHTESISGEGHKQLVREAWSSL
jgi:hypothetical protein